jgi:hypothetical protein
MVTNPDLPAIVAGFPAAATETGSPPANPLLDLERSATYSLEIHRMNDDSVTCVALL